MWLLFVLCIGAVVASMIQLRDKEFDDEDKVLLGHIRERMQGRVLEPMDVFSKPDPELERHYQDTTEYFTKIMEMTAMEDEEEVENNATRRQAKGLTKDQHLDMKADQNITDDGNEYEFLAEGALFPMDLSGRRQRNWRWTRIPSAQEEKERTMDMMQHQIYATQYRMRDLKKIIDQYSNDINYRVAYLYCRLETLLKELDIMYTVVHKGVAKLKAHIHMIYYTYFMRKNIDVTYIVEYMIRIHTEYMASKRIRLVSKPAIANTTGNATSGGDTPTAAPGPDTPTPAPGPDTPTSASEQEDSREGPIGRPKPQP